MTQDTIKLKLIRASQIKFANTNCLTRAEHQDLMSWLEKQEGSQTIYDYLLHLLHQNDREQLQVAIKLCEHNDL